MHCGPRCLSSPVPGKSFAARVAGSLLHAIGLPELVVHSEEHYEAMAIRLATDRALLGHYRERLADNRLTTPLFDMGRFTRGIENAFEDMWRRRCQNIE